VFEALRLALLGSPLLACRAFLKCGGGLRGAPLGLGRLLVALCLCGGLLLGGDPLALDGVLALVGGNLGPQALALDLGLDALLAELCLGLALAGLGLLASRVLLGLDLGLLKPPLAGQPLVAQCRSGRLLRLAGDLPGQAARRLLLVFGVGHCCLQCRSRARLGYPGGRAR
jgi:hypothetical protein